MYSVLEVKPVIKRYINMEVKKKTYYYYIQLLGLCSFSMRIVRITLSNDIRLKYSIKTKLFRSDEWIN